MPSFSQRSLDRLSTCDDRLQCILDEAIQVLDFTVLEGHRNEETQERYFREGKTKAHFGESKHNNIPSLAVDVVPYPIDWNDAERFHRLAGVIQGIAHCHGVKIEWGGDWKTLKDSPHFAIVER